MLSLCLPQWDTPQQLPHPSHLVLEWASQPSQEREELALWGLLGCTIPAAVRGQLGQCLQEKLPFHSVLLASRLRVTPYLGLGELGRFLQAVSPGNSPPPYLEEEFTGMSSGSESQSVTLLSTSCGNLRSGV